MRELTTSEAIRYNRQISIPGFDLDKQELLLNAHVLVVGAGGLGCSVMQYLCASGVGQLTIIDNDQVDKSNLQRQILHFEQDVGKDKVQSAYETLCKINSSVDIHPVKDMAGEHNLPELIKQTDITIDCTDNLKTRNLVNRLCYDNQKPLVSGAAIRMEGQVFCVSPRQNTACYQCISHFFSEQNLSCVESGIMSPVVGIIGATQALEAIKLICEFGSPMVNQLQMYDAMSSSWQTFNVNKQPQCSVCGQ